MSNLKLKLKMLVKLLEVTQNSYKKYDKSACGSYRKKQMFFVDTVFQKIASRKWTRKSPHEEEERTPNRLFLW